MIRPRRLWPLLRFVGVWFVLLLLVLGGAAAGQVFSRELRYFRLREVPGPNVILFAVDALRADVFSYYGGDLATPNLDGLAARGVVFRFAQTVAPATGASFSSILTSRYPPEHGVVISTRRLPSSERTMAEVLRASGYATAAFVSSYIVNSRYGFDSGFETYDDELISRWPGVINEKDSATVLERASAWLDTNHGRKFFLWMHVFDPHSPYRCWTEDFSDGAELPNDFIVSLGQRMGRGDETVGPDIEMVKSCYLSEVRHIDHVFGQLLDTLARNGQLDNTMIIFAADHGESLGDRDAYFGHIRSLYDEVIRVPLIIGFPGGLYAGRTVLEPVSNIDILPTVLDSLAIEMGSERRGISLLPLVEGRTPVTGRSLFSMRESAYWFDGGQAFAVRNGDWKLIEFESAPDELYDVATDPGELVDLSARNPHQYDRLKALLAGWKQDTGYSTFSLNPMWRFLAGWKNSAEDYFGFGYGDPRDLRSLDEEEIRQLRALGYLR